MPATMTETVEGFMAKTAKDAADELPDDPADLPGGNIRFVGDLLYMIEALTLGRRDAGGKKVSNTRYVDERLRPVVTREFEARYGPLKEFLRKKKHGD
jgi:hypothetical protein